MIFSIRCTSIFFVLFSASVFAENEGTPELLIGLKKIDVQRLTPQESAKVRGEAIRKEVSEVGHCGLRRCTKVFINDKHLYTKYDDGSVYFVNYQ